MLNKKWIVIAIFFILLIGVYLSLRLNPPLQSSGLSYNHYDPFTIVAELENKGFVAIKIKEVLINERIIPKNVQLGISRSNNMITIADVRNSSEGISFYDIQEPRIKRPPTSEYNGSFDVSRHYALAVNHNEIMNNIVVKYSYLGMPFELEIDVSEQNFEEYVKDVKKQTFSSNGQTFHLYSLMENVLTYTSNVKANRDVDKTEAYNKYIIEPFNENSFVGFTYSMLINNLSASANIEQLEKNTLELLQSQVELEKLIKEAIEESANHLPLEKDTNVYIFPLDPNDYFTKHNLDGIGGQAYFGNNIFLWIDPSFSTEALKYTVAHEYHHIVNMANNGYRSVANVLDHTLTEGKADVFAKMVYPNYNPKWTQPLTEEQAHIVLEVLKENRQLSYENAYQSLDSHAKEVPQWANYKIGYQIMNNYIDKNPDITLLEWTNYDASEIVLGSDYRDLMEYEEGR